MKMEMEFIRPCFRVSSIEFTFISAPTIKLDVAVAEPEEFSIVHWHFWYEENAHCSSSVHVHCAIGWLCVCVCDVGIGDRDA